MTLVSLDRGHGPLVVLVHGVGLGPETFAPLAECLVDRHRVVVVERPVGTGGHALPLGEQADRLLARLDDLGAAGGRFVGVSGGATLGLRLAIDHPTALGGLVLHEPLVGPLAPELDCRFQAAALAATDDEGAMAVVRSVMGSDTWEVLGPAARARSESAAARWRAEIPEFAAFAPSLAELQALRPRPLLVTVGTRSGPERWAAAQVLRRWCGAELAEVPGAGNAVQIDAPEAFAHLIDTWQTVPTGGPS